jgi:ADP-ribosylglycohydrolase
MDLPRVEQYTGSLIGQCLADALGSPVEGQRPEICRYHVDTVIRAGKAAQLGRGDVPFGQYTDDSQLARELLQSYLHCGGFDAADYAARIAAIFSEGRIFGYGTATKQAVERLLQGVPWQQAGAPSPSAGNGSAMRAGPVGLLYFAEPEALIRVATEQGHITHQDPRCAAGSIVIAGAVALALRGGPIDGARFTATLKSWIGPRDPALGAALTQLPSWLLLPPEQAAGFIAAVGAEAGPGASQSNRWPGISPFVTPSVLWSLYCFLRSPDDYLETVCTAIAAGGDVDTTAAMAGAMSGARLGLAALPGELLYHLNDRGTWKLDALRELAEGCYCKIRNSVLKNPPIVA